MKVLVLGSGGQLGQELARVRPTGVELVAWDFPEIDLVEAASVAARVRALRPEVILNAAAYTAVDAAEGDEARARAINGDAPRHLAELAVELGARIVHVSTDFVFDGCSPRPYAPSDEPSPRSVYGATKRAGEVGVLEVAGASSLVIRTSWLYSSHGKNFALTMLRLLRERGSVKVVADQIGSPTWARGLAEVVWGFAAKPELSGLWHHSDAGVASWYDFAHAIGAEAYRAGLLPQAPEVLPITTADYPTPAQRPPYSVLDCSATRAALGGTPRHWRDQLVMMLKELRDSDA